MKQILIGLGSRARQGKDYAAAHLHKLFPNDTAIFHWADALYGEVANKERKYPLIVDRGNKFDLLTDPNLGEYCSLSKIKTPELETLLFDRGITEYWGMDEKDSPILQFWGTDFRRTFFGMDYWITRTITKIKESGVRFALIPDTRFVNELEKVDYYISLIRNNHDGTRFYDDSRDKDHPSEANLDNADFDYQIEAVSGDVDFIERSILQMFTEIVHLEKFAYPELTEEVHHAKR